MIAICGVGMAALAGLLKKSGDHVSGTDAHVYPPMSTLLDAASIHYKVGYDPNHIDSKTDLVIIGNAVGKDNPEVVSAIERKLPCLSMSAALETFFLKEKTPLVVVGTHGKTTTTSLLSWVLFSAGLDPGMMVGGWARNFNANYLLGKGPYFVVEGDEYDTAYFDKGPKFLHYRPHHAILTSIEFDHADIYPDLASIKEAFRKFVRLIPPTGLLLTASESSSILEVIQDAACKIESYGMDAKADWQAESVQVKGPCIGYDVVYRGVKVASIESPLLGVHNLKNTLAVIALAHHIGVSWENIGKAVRAFQGVKRRQEVIGNVRDILIIDDFGHHPTAIFETLSALRLRYPSRKIWSVFEPRSATSRRNVFQKAFVPSFAPADCVILADVFAGDKIAPEARLDPEKIVSDLTAMGKTAYFIPDPNEIVRALSERLQPGDLVCMMSSGGFAEIHQKLMLRLQEKAS